MGRLWEIREKSLGIWEFSLSNGDSHEESGYRPPNPHLNLNLNPKIPSNELRTNNRAGGGGQGCAQGVIRVMKAYDANSVIQWMNFCDTALGIEFNGLDIRREPSRAVFNFIMLHLGADNTEKVTQYFYGGK